MSEISQSPNQKAWAAFKRNRPALISLLFLTALTLTVLIWPKITPYPSDTVTDEQFHPPSSSHWFGTDVHGRDLLTRVFFGARVSLLVGIVGAAVAFVIGVSWGSIAGYVGGKWDSFMMRCVDILYSLPSILFVIVLVATFNDLMRKLIEKYFGSAAGSYVPMLFLFVGLGAVSWLTMARIVRGQVLTLRHRQFVDASRSLGASHLRILSRHILPNIYGIIIVYLTLTVPAIILYESFLSYLGLGIQPPMASWGSLIAEGAQQLNPIRIYWWLLVFPASMLVITLLAMNFVGDGLRDAFDPRSKS
ncbi:MAG TPA: ABC transporter permease [Candidatus Saccharimonadales bacterium]|nr:ABC transporter permease [Candidatus Saccharimonadales bacterium]